MKATAPMQPFNDPDLVSHYAEATPRRVPGFADLHRMALLLLSEHATEAARILVLGAGGGLELKTFAEARPDWSFVGVDPSAPMLDLAKHVLGPLGSQVAWVHGYVEHAPPGPFDGATCLLTLHFLPRPERLRVLQAIRRRLSPGAPLIIAHHSIPEGAASDRWLTRSAAFAAGPTPDPGQVAAAASGLARHLPLLSTHDEEALLREAGFCDVALFYAGFSFRGWVAVARDT
ncbi:class I SAM-dependent methyltransferase [Chelatococcus asaccharovorans]|nr:class I SAM-dependent methyltransferase [Chelatococcus asaccharovorans]